MAKSKLGKLIARFPCRPMRPLDLAVLALPGSLATLLPLAYGYYRGSLAAASFGPAAVQKWSQPWYYLSILGLAVYALLVIIRIWLSTHSINVHRQGLRLNIGLPRSLRWEQISGIRLAVYQRRFFSFGFQPSYTAWLLPAHGRSIRMPGMPRLPELISHIKAHLYPKLIQLLRSDFENNHWLYFGPLAIHKDGFRNINSARPRRAKNLTHPWNQINQVSVKAGFLVIDFLSGDQQKIPVSEIPNIELLLEVIQFEVSL